MGDCIFSDMFEFVYIIYQCLLTLSVCLPLLLYENIKVPDTLDPETVGDSIR